MPLGRRARSALAAFDDETSRLYLHGDGVTMLFPWPMMKAMRRRDGTGRWQRARPSLLIAPPDSVARDALTPSDAAIAKFCELIPADVRATVAAFREHHWELLVFVARCGDAARDLLAANPALGYMLAHPTEFRRPPKSASLDEARLILAPRRKQRDALAWLGFPPTEPVRRILRKIPPAEVTLPPLPALGQQVVRPDVQHRLAHLPTITGTVLRITAGGALPLFTPGLLRRVSEVRLPRPYDLAGLATDTAEMWREVYPDQPLPCLSSFRRLVEAHDDLATITALRAQAVKDPHPLPMPPIPGTDEIVPITSVEMLCEEGATQDNCVASYVSRIRQRRVFVYRVLRPSRATLSIVRHAGYWRIDQLESARNQDAPSYTVRAVVDWLEQARPQVLAAQRSVRRRRRAPAAPLLEILERQS